MPANAGSRSSITKPVSYQCIASVYCTSSCRDGSFLLSR